MKEYPLEFNGIQIDPIIFTQGFVPGCNMKICHGQCCNWGVYMDKDFQKKIGEICKNYRLNILQINLTDFAKLNDENLKNINAFEHGRANNIKYLYMIMLNLRIIIFIYFISFVHCIIT